MLDNQKHVNNHFLSQLKRTYVCTEASAGGDDRSSITNMLSLSEEGMIQIRNAADLNLIERLRTTMDRN